jgi:hypothetical protein
VVETDDDNIPLDSFWEPRSRVIDSTPAASSGWCNVYRDFSHARIWPRGFPLENINQSLERAVLHEAPVPQECLIQQGLADDNPDVDAVYRLTSLLPIQFQRRSPINLGRDCWCPFNSQNTTFFREAAPLLYLPSFCTFRMTDIWRAFVAQRCLWEMGSTVAFTSASMSQVRNDHNLLRDFELEIPGYLNSERIRETLAATTLRPGREPGTVGDNLYRCYEALVRARIIPAEELPLVDSWNQDILSLV